MRKTYFVHIFNTLADISSSEIAWSGGPLCEHRQRDTFSINWQQYR